MSAAPAVQADGPDVSRAIEQRVAQGLDRYVTDPAVLAALGELVLAARNTATGK